MARCKSACFSELGTRCGVKSFFYFPDPRPKLLVANRYYIFLVNITTGAYEEIKSNCTNAVAVDFDWQDQYVYWTDITFTSSSISRKPLNDSNAKVRKWWRRCGGGRDDCSSGDDGCDGGCDGGGCDGGGVSGGCDGGGVSGGCDGGGVSGGCEGGGGGGSDEVGSGDGHDDTESDSGAIKSMAVMTAFFFFF